MNSIVVPYTGIISLWSCRGIFLPTPFCSLSNTQVVEDISPGVSESEHEDSTSENETPDSKEQSVVSNAPSMSLQGLRPLNNTGNHDSKMREQYPALLSSLPHSLTGHSILIVMLFTNL